MRQAVCEVGTKMNKMHVSVRVPAGGTHKLRTIQAGLVEKGVTTSIVQYPEPRNFWTAAT